MSTLYWFQKAVDVAIRRSKTNSPNMGVYIAIAHVLQDVIDDDRADNARHLVKKVAPMDDTELEITRNELDECVNAGLRAVVKEVFDDPRAAAVKMDNGTMGSIYTEANNKKYDELVKEVPAKKRLFDILPTFERKPK